MTGLIVRLAMFGVGVAVGAVLHLRFGWKHIWSFVVALVVYVILDFAAELLLFGHLA